MKRTGASTRRLLLALVLMALLGSPFAPAAAAVNGPGVSPAAPPSADLQAPERSTFDQLTGAAAIVSIAVVGVAGVYIYRLIRKGL